MAPSSRDVLQYKDLLTLHLSGRYPYDILVSGRAAAREDHSPTRQHQSLESGSVARRRHWFHARTCFLRGDCQRPHSPRLAMLTPPGLFTHFHFVLVPTQLASRSVPQPGANGHYAHRLTYDAEGKSFNLYSQTPLVASLSQPRLLLCTRHWQSPGYSRGQGCCDVTPRPTTALGQAP